ncbi:MAG TPA: NUDIX domain-containing protein [Nevskiaceae bacterium]
MRATIPVRCSMVSILALRGAPAAPEVLLLRRASRYLEGVWSYVAGHIEAGETGWQAARRELREETGLDPSVWYSTTFCEQFYEASSNTIEVVPAFVARVAAPAATVRLNAESTALRWVPIAEAGALVPFGSQRDLFAFVVREFATREPSAFLRLSDDETA